MQIISKPVSNFVQGRQKYQPEAVILYLLSDPLDITIAKCNAKNSKLSYHYIVGAKGEVWQLTNEQDTAWHSPGIMQSDWRFLKQRVNTNLYSIGIAVNGTPGEKLTEESVSSLRQLFIKISERWNIPIDAEHIISPDKIDSRLQKEYISMRVELPKIIASLNLKKKSKQMSDYDIEILKSKVQNLELRNSALESRLIDTDKDTDTKQIPELDELRELLKQNSRLSEEVYLLQHELHFEKSRIKDLENRLDDFKGKTPLSLYTFRELIVSAIRKIVPI